MICALPLSFLAKLVAEFKAFDVRGMTSVNQRLANIEASMKKCTAKSSGTHAQVLVEVFGPSNVLNDLPALTREAFEEWDAKLVEDRKPTAFAADVVFTSIHCFKPIKVDLMEAMRLMLILSLSSLWLALPALSGKEIKDGQVRWKKN